MRRRADFGPQLIGRLAELRAVVDELSGSASAGSGGSAPVGPACPGVLIAGPAGVGKSRLAREAIAELARLPGGWAAGRSPRRLLTVRTTGSAADLPLSGLLGALPGLPAVGGNPASWALAAMRELAESADTALFIDDIQQLDEASAGVVAQLVADRTVSVLATLRTDREPPQVVTALWKDLGVARLELAELSADEIDELVTATLGGPVEGRTLHQLREAAGGNPLLLRELLLSAHDLRLLARAGGLWRLTGKLGITAQLTELLDERLAATGFEHHDTLELLAFGEPLPLAVATDLAGPLALEELERRGLLTVVEDGARRLVRLSHPLYGELLRGRAPELARLRHSRMLADALARTLVDHPKGTVEQSAELRSADGRHDVMRVALWRLDGGGPANAELMLAAAQHATLIREHELAARLAASGYDAGGGVPAGLATAAALFQCGRLDEALAWCDRLRAEAADDAEVAMLAVQHASILAHGADDAHAGLAVVDEAALRVFTPSCRELLTAARLYLRSYQLDCTVAPAAAAAFVGAGSLDARLAAASALGGAHMLAGRLAQSARTVDQATPLAAGHAGSGRLHTDSMQAAYGWMRAHQPDPAGALAQAQEVYAASIQPPDRPAQALAAFTLAQIALLLGRPDTAGRWASEAGVVAEQFQLRPIARWAAGLRAQAAAQLGAGPVLELAVRELAARPAAASSVLLFEMDVARGWAWHAATHGDTEAVRRLLAAEVRRHGDLGAVGLGALGALDLIRLGHPRVAACLLAEYPCPPGWRLGALVTEYAAAATAGDGARLLLIAHEFARRRMALHAAEAARLAADAWQRVDGPATARALLLGDAQLAGCAAAAAPSLRLVDVAGGLTERESQLVRLAAAGEPSRLIAARLHLSERTVENHLHRAYGKLGVSGREDVRLLLAAGA